MPRNKSFHASSLAALFAALALAFLSVGCSGSESSSGSGGGSSSTSGGSSARSSEPAGPVTIEFWHAMSGEHDRLISDFAREFSEKTPNVTVKAVYQGQYSALKLNLQNALATGTSPALAQVYEGWTSAFLDKGHIRPVEKFIGEEKDGYKDALDDFYPAWLDNNRYGDMLVSLPFNKSMFLVFYNKDMFDAAGIDNFPTDEAGLREAAEKLTKKDAAGNTVVHGLGLRSTLEPFTVLMNAYGGRYMNETDDAGDMLILNTEAAHKSLEFAREMNDSGFAYVDGGYMSQPFGSESIAFYWGSSAGIPFVEKGVGGKFNWGAASLPDLSGDGSNGFLSQGTNIAIFSKVSDAEQRAGWEFMKYVMEPAQVARWSAATGYMPVRRSASDDPVLAEVLATNPAFVVAVDQLEKASFEPNATYWEEIRNEVWTELESALSGRSTVDEALESAEARARRIARQAMEDE